MALFLTKAENVGVHSRKRMKHFVQAVKNSIHSCMLMIPCVDTVRMRAQCRLRAAGKDVVHGVYSWVHENAGKDTVFHSLYKMFHALSGMHTDFHCLCKKQSRR
jgi:hypothetical protein